MRYSLFALIFFSFSFSAFGALMVPDDGTYTPAEDGFLTAIDLDDEGVHFKIDTTEWWERFQKYCHQYVYPSNKQKVKDAARKNKDFEMDFFDDSKGFLSKEEYNNMTRAWLGGAYHSDPVFQPVDEEALNKAARDMGKALAGVAYSRSHEVSVTDFTDLFIKAGATMLGGL